MYCEYFSLREYPFSITPDTSFFYSSEASKKALNTLLVATEMGEGFIKVVGEIGTGKTLICRKLIELLESGNRVAYIPNPYLDPAALFEELSIELGIRNKTSPAETPQRLLRDLKDYLLEECQRGGKIVICLDEAQSMPIETLEALRLLSNLETGKRKLVQVLIFGQPELDHKLALPDIRQLRQRISFEYYLAGMDRNETARYVAHRMSVAGHKGPSLFSRLALRLLHLWSRGVPRLVNLLAHKSLLSAFGKGNSRVGALDVVLAVMDTRSPRKAGTVLGTMASLLLLLPLFQSLKGMVL